MATTVLYSQSSMVEANAHRMHLCPVRNELIQTSPEESVRQSLLALMLEDLGYPASLMVVERKISQLPHLAHVKVPIPNRRIDILCYSRNCLRPLILIECKARFFSFKEQRQLFGYNYHIGASFLALVAHKKIHFFNMKNAEEVSDVKELPDFATLTEWQNLY